MESNLHEDSKSSSCEEGTDRSNEELGTGRSYECVFCKRGFTTAQALGGHMNIHRKDRANNGHNNKLNMIRPNSVPPSSAKNSEEGCDFASLRGYSAIQSYPPSHHHEVLISYQTFFPDNNNNDRWDFRSQHSHDFYVQSPQLFNHFQDDWRASLNLQIGPSNLDLDHNNQKTEEEEEEEEEEEDELDLELRLGHHHDP